MIKCARDLSNDNKIQIHLEYFPLCHVLQAKPEKFVFIMEWIGGVCSIEEASRVNGLV